jgi:CelD/BcsL family acetyltransferase involved in cellulose biosynthesis
MTMSLVSAGEMKPSSAGSAGWGVGEPPRPEGALKRGRGAPRAEVLRGRLDLIDRLADEWRALCDEGPSDQPFYGPEWIRAHVRAFAPGAELVVIAVRRDERLSAVLPLMRERTSFRGLPVTTLRSIGNEHSPRFDLIHGRDAESAALVVWRALRATPSWDVVELRDVPHGGALEHLSLAAAADGYPIGCRASDRRPYIALPRDSTLDAILQRARPSFRHTLRRCMRRLEERGPVRLVHSETADAAALERFYALERAGWKGAAGTAIACDGSTRQFYDEVAQEAARLGRFSLYTLECGGRAVAIQYGLAQRGRYFALKSAYDEAFRPCSPGQLIMQEILRDLIARGFTELDLLGSAQEYKEQWAPEMRTHTCSYVFRPGLLGRLIHTARFRIRPAVDHVSRRLRASFGWRTMPDGALDRGERSQVAALASPPSTVATGMGC